MSGFFLNNYEDLHKRLIQMESSKQRTLLIGVSFALLDFAERFSLKLKYTSIIETGGMKGRRKEITRSELHERLKAAFGLAQIYSEYGMTELLSQAYSLGDGIFRCPPWMKVLIRDPYDPLTYVSAGKTGGLNIIDLANQNSCSFIQTGDIGKLYEDGSFEVLGRMDSSQLRGCNLMVE